MITVHMPGEWDEEAEFDDATEFQVDERGRLIIYEPAPPAPQNTEQPPLFTKQQPERVKVAQFNEDQWGYVEIIDQEDNDD